MTLCNFDPPAEESKLHSHVILTLGSDFLEKTYSVENRKKIFHLQLKSFDFKRKNQKKFKM